MTQKLFLILPVAGAMAFAAAGANAADLSPYVGAKFGGTIGGSSATDSSGGNPIYLGYNFGLDGGVAIPTSFINLRAEFEYNHTGVKSTNADVSDTLTANSYMVNGYLDFLSGYRIKPYLGAGLGAISLNEKVDGDSASATKFGYGIYGGFWFNITNALAMDLGAQYKGANANGVSFSFVNFNLGLRYAF